MLKFKLFIGLTILYLYDKVMHKECKWEGI